LVNNVIISYHKIMSDIIGTPPCKLTNHILEGFFVKELITGALKETFGDWIKIDYEEHDINNKRFDYSLRFPYTTKYYPEHICLSRCEYWKSVSKAINSLLEDNNRPFYDLIRIECPRGSTHHLKLDKGGKEFNTLIVKITDNGLFANIASLFKIIYNGGHDDGIEYTGYI
jgi:hypothetical protein